MNTDKDIYDWKGPKSERWAAHLEHFETMLEPVNASLLSALAVDASSLRLADIGCGGGGATRALRHHAPSTHTVDGFDISPQLVALAQARARDLAITFHVADMSRALPPEAPYDRLMSRFGVMFFEEPEAAFAHIAQWLVPGGRFAFAVWDAPARNPWVMAVREVVEQLADLPPADPEAPGPFRYAKVEAFLELLARAGFVEVEALPWRGAVPLGASLGAEGAADFAL